MITGFNQDVTYNGKVYHVQTEDRGLENPIIESLIYVGGEILSSKKTSYEEAVEDGYDEARIAALLEQQHRRVVVDIKLGKYDDEAPKAFGDGILSNRSLDEVILDYLNAEGEKEKLMVELLDQSPITSGASGHIKLRASGEITHGPIQGAEVTVVMNTSSGTFKELFRGDTNKDGLCTASFSLPETDANAVVIIGVTHEKGTYENKILVTKSKS